MSPEAPSDYLGLPISTIYAWRTRGKGPLGMRVGKHVRYRQSVVEAWLAEQEQDALAEQGQDAIESTPTQEP